MTTPNVFAVVLVGIALAGVVFIILVCWHWHKVGRVVNDLFAKILAGVVKLFAGVVSICGAYTAAHKEEWLLPAITGAVCVVLWEVLEKLIDNRAKAADKADKEALTRADKLAETRTELLTVFRRAVAEKVKRLMKVMAKRKHKPSVSLIRLALTPDSHLDDLLDSLAAYFAEQLPPTAPATTNFRVGLYATRNGSMAPVRAANLNNPAYDVFTSYAAHEQAFRLDADRPAHVVACVREKRTIIVPNCEAAAAVGDFFFFNDNQRGYLRSMAAYYLGQICCDDGASAEAALVVDTDWAGYFSENNRDSLEFCLREFGARIKLELLLHAVLVEREAET